ncbi:MAG: hypothetical protein JOZ65_04420 [Chloroflexi bacterium]|nr:hypothetical protein [Chloroflexota bacterium]
MNESRPQDAAAEPEAATTPYLRLPVPLVAIGLVVFLAALLGVGLWANANLRQRGSVPTLEAPTTVGVAAAPTSTAAPAVTDARTLTPAPTSTPVPIVQATPTAVAAAEAATQPRPAPTATYAPTPLVIVLGRTEAPTAPASATDTPATVRPTIEPELEAEVEQAYQTYWQVRAEALYQLDTSHLQDVMAGEHLSAVEERIEQLQSEGRAIETEVDHNYVVVEASGDDAQVADSYIDRSFYVDAHSRAAVSVPTGQQVNELYAMKRTEGTWKVVDLARSQ